MTLSGSANHLYEDQVFAFMNQLVTRVTLQLAWVVYKGASLGSSVASFIFTSRFPVLFTQSPRLFAGFQNHNRQIAQTSYLILGR